MIHLIREKELLNKEHGVVQNGPIAVRLRYKKLDAATEPW